MKSLAILFFMAIFLCLSCNELSVPVSAQIAHAKVLSNHVITTRAYEIPNGIFRGVLWPSKSEKNFKIWIIKNGNEVFFNIPASPEFVDNNKDTTEEWKIRMSDTSQNRIIYFADRKDGSKSLQIELPLKKRKYSFSILKNTSSEEMLLFMDISEDVADKGLFGYVILKNKT